MKSLRGATSLPMSSSKTRSAASSVAQRHLAQGAVARVHRRVGELVGVHLTQALVALQRLLDLLAPLLEARRACVRISASL